MNIRKKLKDRLKLVRLDLIPFCVSWLANARENVLDKIMLSRSKYCVSVKIFCQVHDDSDIVEDWIR